MEDSFLKIKYDKLIFEIKFLEADLQYHDGLLEKAIPEFNSKCRDAIEEMGLGKFFFGEGSAGEESAKLDQKKEKPKILVSKATESLFKKIATKTHPDKLISLEEKERDLRKEKFQEATKAKEEDNLMKLHIIASELGIEIPELTLEDLLSFEKKTEELKELIQQKKGTIMWSWVTSTEQKKEEIMNQYVGVMVSSIQDKLKNNTED